MFSINSEVLAQDWDAFAAHIPVDLNEVAVRTKAVERERKIADGKMLLRFILALVATRFSYQNVAALIAAAIGASYSKQALRKRVYQSVPFLQAVLDALLYAQTGVRTDDVTRPVVLIDGSVTARAGAENATERLHCALDAATLEPIGILLTDTKAAGAEALTRFDYEPGTLLVGDRGYAHASEIARLYRQGVDTLVRAPLSNICLAQRPSRSDSSNDRSKTVTPWGRGDIINTIDALNLPELGHADIPVWILPKQDHPVPARLIVVRKTAAATAAAIKKIHAAARRHGHQTKPLTLAQAPYVILLTTVSVAEMPAETLGAIYRNRWQIELYYKHLKSELGYDRVRAKRDDARRAELLAVLIEALLVAAIRRDLSLSRGAASVALERARPR